MAKTHGAGAYLYTAGTDPVGSARAGHPVGGPVGGGLGYQHYYNPADFGTLAHRVKSDSELKAALAIATAGHLVWIESSFSVPACGKDARSGVILKTGAILASGRGRSGAPVVTFAGTLGDHWVHPQANTRISGISIQGDNKLGSSYPAFSCLSYSGQQFENLWIRDVGWGWMVWGANGADWDGTKWNAATPYIHHCDMAGARHAGGNDSYGVQVGETTGGFLLEACILDDCRHITMCKPGLPENNGGSQYEVAYCDIGDCMGYNGVQHQIDWHGNGCSGYGAQWSGYRVACRYSHIHYNTFSANAGASNCCMRGLVVESCEVDHNWTKKTDHSGVWPANGADEVANSSLARLAAEENGTWECEMNKPKYNYHAHDNWWGLSEPPEGAAPPLRRLAAAVAVMERR
jgi:hypothetical protein